MGQGGRPGEGPRSSRGRRAMEGRSTHPERDFHGRHQPDRRAGEGCPGSGAGRADPGRRHLRPGRRSIRNRRVGPGCRGQWLAEGLDGRPGADFRGRLSARMGSRRCGEDAQVLLRPDGPQDERRGRADAVDSGRGCHVPVGRGPAVDGAGDAGRDLAAPRRRRRRGSRRSADPRLQAPGRPPVRVGHGHRRLDTRRPRLEGLQRQAAQVRSHRRRRSGRPQGQDLPHRAPRPRNYPGHLECDGGPGADAVRARSARHPRRCRGRRPGRRPQGPRPGQVRSIR